MDLAQYLPFLENKNIGSVTFIIIFIIGQFFTFLITNTKSKSTVQEKIVEQAMNRQSQLDNSQKEMMNTLQKEIQNIKDDAEKSRLANDAERERNRAAMLEELERYNSLSEKYSRLMKENNELQDLVTKLSKEGQERIEQNEKLIEQNTLLFEKVELLDKELQELKRV